MLELEDYCHLQELFLKTTVTVSVKIGRLLSFKRTLLEDHCHFHCQLQGLNIRIGRLLSFTRTLLEEHCHCHYCHC